MTSKLHVAVDALGNPLRVRLTGGQVGEMTQGEALVEALPAQFLIADTAYDADRFRSNLSNRGITTVIPNNPTRVIRYPLDTTLYKERHLVECFFNKLKHFRRLATRYDKTAKAYLAFFAIAATMIWLR